MRSSCNSSNISDETSCMPSTCPATLSSRYRHVIVTLWPRYGHGIDTSSCHDVSPAGTRAHPPLERERECV
eukprot:540923-Rhodomonas_salina.1